MKKIKIKIASVAIAIATLCGMLAFSGQVNAASCGEPTMLASALRGRPITISGIQIGKDKMETLWRIATTPPEESTPFFGKVIAEDQDWLSSCQYPGIGIGAGSGMSWQERSVTLWVWADAVDLSAARLSIYRLIGAVVASTTTTTTTTPQSSADWVVGFGDAKYDGSTIVQPMSDNSLIVASSHGASQTSSIAVRRIDASGATEWKSSIFGSLDFKATNVEMTASTLLPGNRALFLGHAERSTLDIALLLVDAAGTSSQIVVEDSGQSYAHVITTCSDGSVYIGGESQGPTTDSFIVRLSASLNVEWAKHFGAPEKNDRLLALSCNKENSVTLSAWAGGSLAGDNADDLYTFYTMEMSESGVTTKTVELERDYGEFSPQSAVFSSDKSLYIVGESNNYYREMACTEKAIGGSFISKYAASGLLEWRKILPCGNLNRKAVVSSTGDIIVVGTASSVRVAGQQKFGGDDFLLHRYSNDGVRISTQQFGSVADDVASSLALDESDNVYIGGYVKGNFGGHVNAGDWDAVVIRQHADNSPAPTPATTTTTTLVPITTTTATIAAPQELAMTTTTTALIQYAVAQAVSVAAPVAVQTLRVEVKKASAVTKVATAKSKTKIVKTKKPTKKKAVKKK